MTARRGQVIVCSFSAVEELKGKKLTYENLKAAVLRAGRFSVFEATETDKKARLYTRLCQDPELEIENEGYPWTRVRRRA